MKRGAVKEQTRYEFTDLHASNLPEMPTSADEEIVRKRLLDMFQPYGAVMVKAMRRESKNYGYGRRTAAVMRDDDILHDIIRSPYC